MDALRSLSDSLAALGQAAAAKLFHVPSPLGGRTALGFDGKRLLVPAFDAGEGEVLELLGPGGKPLAASVRGFDPARGLAVLELEAALPGTAFAAAPGLPPLGSLVLSAAYPSPQGPELRLDLVRFAGGEGEESYLQTDGPPFPGFSGAALVAPDGTLAGFLLADRPGNRGWALPAARAEALVRSIAEAGFAKRAWLGVSTLPVEAPEAFAAHFGDGRESALVVVGLERDGPAAKAGLLPGDFLVSLGGRATADPGELRAALGAARPGEPLAVVAVRGGKRLEFEALPGAAPAEGRERRGRPGPGGHPGCRGRMPWGCGPGR